MFWMNNSNPIKIPLSPRTDLSGLVPTISEQSKMKSLLYLFTIRFLKYLVTITQPDIAYAVSYLDRFNHNPHLTHWTAIKNLFYYLKETNNYKLIYFESNNSELFQTYFDASHGGCKENRYVTIACRMAVGWSSNPLSHYLAQKLSMW